MHDVLIIGAGVIGSAIARELSRFRLDAVVVERGSDVAMGASKANSGIVHGGYDALPGTLRARCNIAGNPLFDSLAAELDFPFKRIGSLVLAFAAEEIPALEQLLERGRENGVPGLRLVGREELVRLEPNISPSAFAALQVPSGGIVCPYEMTVALAENAATNGVRFVFDHAVESVKKTGAGFRVAASGRVFEARFLVNAAGVHADEINNALSSRPLRIVPRRGEYFLLDRTEGVLVNHTLFQLPGKTGKGVLVTPSVDGNILVGPTADDLGDKEDTETTADGIARVVEMACRDVTSMPHAKTIASFAGLRAHEATGDDFVVGPSPDVPGFFNAAGIDSPGLSSAPAIGRDLACMVAQAAGAAENPHFIPVRRATPRFRHMSLEEKRDAIARNANYGEIVCRCETVTKAEILGALRSPLGVRDMDAIKRRTRAGMGRCQGGFCGMLLPGIIAEETGMPLAEITKFGGGSRLFTSHNKDAWREERP